MQIQNGDRPGPVHSLMRAGGGAGVEQEDTVPPLDQVSMAVAEDPHLRNWIKPAPPGQFGQGKNRLALREADGQDVGHADRSPGEVQEMHVVYPGIDDVVVIVAPGSDDRSDPRQPVQNRAARQVPGVEYQFDSIEGRLDGAAHDVVERGHVGVRDHADPAATQVSDQTVRHWTRV